MRVARVLGIIVTVAGAMFAVEAAAFAGGGCHQPASQAAGTTVELSNFCMSPTVLRVDVGETVTFINRDASAHNVVSSAMYADLRNQGDRASYRFDEAGIFPYACTLHAGMTGAVVAGDGQAAGARVVEVAGAEPIAAVDGTANDGAALDRRLTAVAVAAALALAVLGFLVGRRTGPAAPRR